ncbi:hypothetical protein [Aeromicrobium sp. UC242_57]|uniref:hypothetical protein n=1 Tax=Aeromicrobium sp. UC242_57 TaxID=3374624 RepID=UPI0037898253
MSRSQHPVTRSSFRSRPPTSSSQPSGPASTTSGCTWVMTPRPGCSCRNTQIGVELSVRDDGPGIPPGRLEEAASHGRLGVAESIRGRLEALGGTAELTTGTFGTEWELVVARHDVDSS